MELFFSLVRAGVRTGDLFISSFIFQHSTAEPRQPFHSVAVLEKQGILTEGEGSVRLVDLLIKAACFVKNVNNIFNIS
jgi:hypothetical protein